MFVLPAISRHDDTLGLSHTVEVRALFEIFLAANALGIAEAGLRQGINVTPVWTVISQYLQVVK